ncbi:MAG: DoxX family membrane protein [Pseudomonadota bacterium]
MFPRTSPHEAAVQAQAALALRVGLGLVFVIGGIAKLERLLTPAKAGAIVEQYTGPAGYINQVFLDWLFAGHLPAFVTPWTFLTALSTFELVSGLMLVVGLMVRPLALIWAFLVWTFVISLPVVTTPGVVAGVTTYESPALLVQARDIALSGLFFVLYNLGSGARSLDAARYGLPPALGRDWDNLGLVLRLSLGIVFVVGGLFHGFSKIATFDMPALLLVVVGLGLLAGIGVRAFALAAGLALLVFMAGKLDGANGIIGYFNSVKREFALLAAAGVLAVLGADRAFTLDALSRAAWAGGQRYVRGRAAA